MKFKIENYLITDINCINGIFLRFTIKITEEENQNLSELFSDLSFSSIKVKRFGSTKWIIAGIDYLFRVNPIEKHLSIAALSDADKQFLELVSKEMNKLMKTNSNSITII